jgi:hypothetical protein
LTLEPTTWSRGIQTSPANAGSDRCRAGNHEGLKPLSRRKLSNSFCGV